MSHILEEVRKANNPNRGANTHQLTVSADNIGELMNNLTNLYADPAVGCFREVLSNAVDSHVNLAGNTSRPIKVTSPGYGSGNEITMSELLSDVYPEMTLPQLPNRWANDYDPTSLHNNLVIRDFGTGMSREQLVNNLLSYGNGTKKDSKTQIGRFGYGGKSPLAVATSFTVRSVQDGQLNSLVVSRDPDDSSIPPSFEWDSGMEDGPVATTEPNGVTITVSYMNVRSNWTPKLLELIGLPKNTVEIDDVLWDITVDNEELFTPVLSNGEIVAYVSKNEHVSNNLQFSGVYMMVNNIVYRVKSDKVGNSDKFYSLAQWDTPVILKAPKNGVKFTPSRDDFIYNELTRSTIEAVADAAHDSIFEKIQDAINTNPSRASVAALYDSLKSANFPNAHKLTYRTEGEISQVLSELSHEYFTGVAYTDNNTYYYNYGRSSSAKWVLRKGERGHHNLGKFISDFATVDVLMVDVPVTEDLVKAVRRYADRISQYSGMLSGANRLFRIVNRQTFAGNKWAEEIISKFARDYETVLAETKAAISAERKAQREADKANGAAPVKRSKPALFVTAEIDDETGNIVLTGNFKGKPADLATGENFYYADSAARGISGFTMSEFADIPVKQVSKNRDHSGKTRVAIEAAKAKGATLVVLSSRQEYDTMVAKFGAGQGAIEPVAEEYAVERATFAPMPSLGDIYNNSYAFRDLFDTEQTEHIVDNIRILKSIYARMTEFYKAKDAVFSLGADVDAMAATFDYDAIRAGAYAQWERSEESFYNTFANITVRDTPGIREYLDGVGVQVAELAERYRFLNKLASSFSFERDDLAEVDAIVQFAINK